MQKVHKVSMVNDKKTAKIKELLEVGHKFLVDIDNKVTK